MKNKNNQKLNWPSNIWVTVDTVIFSIDNNELKVLLAKRPIEPFKNRWSLPGGFITKNETAAKAAKRVLRQKTGFGNGYLEQLFTFDGLRRDSRGRVISIAYFALTPSREIKLAKNSGSLIALFSIKKLPVLAFDHKTIVQCAVRRLRAKLEYTNAAYSLLPYRFTFGQLQKTYEIILDRELDKRNFRKKFGLLGLIKPTGRSNASVSHRPAQLYQFVSRQPAELKKFF